MRYRFSLAALAVVVFAPLTAPAQTHGDAGVTHAPAAPSTLMLHGAPLPNTVDVYRLAEPVVEPFVSDQEAAPVPRQRRTLIGTAVGAIGGCLFGVVGNARYGEPDEGARMCGAFALMGAGAGALVTAATR